MRIIAERRPELAERLERLRQHDPERFDRVIGDAFMVEIERALEEVEADFGPPGAHPPTPAGPWPPQPPRPPGIDPRMRKLHERNGQLEAGSHKLAEKVRRLQHEGARPEAVGEVRERLRAVVDEHFEIRTQLRRAKLERIEREMEELKRRVGEMRHEFERRAAEREAIIERRVQQLLGEEFGGW